MSSNYNPTATLNKSSFNTRMTSLMGNDVSQHGRDSKESLNNLNNTNFYSAKFNENDISI